jgi:hypothetical protein
MHESVGHRVRRSEREISLQLFLGQLSHSDLPRLGLSDHLVEQSEHRGVTPQVVDVDQGGGAVQGPHSLESKIVGVIKIVGHSVGRGNQCPKCATPLCAPIRRRDRKAISVSCELTTAPAPLILNKSARLLDNLDLE